MTVENAATCLPTSKLGVRSSDEPTLDDETGSPFTSKLSYSSPMSMFLILSKNSSGNGDSISNARLKLSPELLWYTLIVRLVMLGVVLRSSTADYSF